ncbi:unnamed protein product [Ectocarpus sp. CCAP 1310/34]|nr:unnamed protein product [Ectocarpus sp. CCAP 1310/34]
MFITDSLDAVGNYSSEPAWVGFGVAEHSVKALQRALSSDSLGGQLDKDGQLPGYGVSLNFNRERSFGEFGHFYDGQRVGLWLGPDGPHEGNHQGSCQMKYGGVSRCPQLTGVNCNVHEQNHSKKTKHLPSVSGMGFDTFTLNITLINELENVKSTARHAAWQSKVPPDTPTNICMHAVRKCGLAVAASAASLL